MSEFFNVCRHSSQTFSLESRKTRKSTIGLSCVWTRCFASGRGAPSADLVNAPAW